MATRQSKKEPNINLEKYYKSLTTLHTYTGTDERTVVHSQAHEQRACSASKWEETPQLSVAGTGRAVSLRRPQPMHNGQESLVSLLL